VAEAVVATAEGVRGAVRRGLPYLETVATAWMGERKCNSCHTVTFLVWSHNEAAARGLDVDRGKLAAMLAGSGDCIAFTSPSTIKNLAKLFDTHDLGKTLPNIVVACIGSVTAEAAAEYGLQVDIKPEQFTTKDLAQAIAAYFSAADERG